MSVTVFEAKDYKEFLKAWILARPKGGRGESRRLAERLNISTTLVSQVLNGDKHFTMETSSEICDHLGLTDRESDHFLLLVDFARAGSQNLKTRINRKIQQSRHHARELSVRLTRDRDLTDAESAVFYSHWIYTAIVHLTAVEPSAGVDRISERVRVPTDMVNKVLNFLIESGILLNQGGSYAHGVKVIHIGADSPLVTKHHQNWRLQGFNRMPYADKEKNVFYTFPMSMSKEVADYVRSDLPNYIEKVHKLVGPSTSEVLRCLNIDWFEF